MVSLDGTGCLEGEVGVDECCWCRSGHSSDCTILAIICVHHPPRRYIVITLPTPSNLSLRPRWRPIDQPASLRLIIRPLSNPSAARTAAGFLEAS
ncbi:hypothetical protein TNCV_1375611 [Trichonephila clavipes]|nr:hypothetical protein TNCV_1375611 [Trichonephila clavipes]